MAAHHYRCLGQEAAADTAAVDADLAYRDSRASDWTPSLNDYSLVGAAFGHSIVQLRATLTANPTNP